MPHDARPALPGAAAGHPAPDRPVYRIMGSVLAVLWPVEVARLLFEMPGAVTWGASGLFLTFLALALATGDTGTRALTVLLLAGIAALVHIDGAGAEAAAGFQDAMIFAAFLPSVFLLRNAVAGDRRLVAYRDRVAAADPERKKGLVLMGGHLIGSTLTVGAFAVLSPVVPAEAGERERRDLALAAIFGVCLSVIWSPVFVAMAVVSEFMPQVALWKFVLLGLGLAALGLTFAFARISVPSRLALAADGVRGLSGILPWVVATAGVIVGLRAVTELSTLEAAALTLPPLAAALLAMQPGGGVQAALAATGRSLRRLGAEISIVAWAFTLGAVMRASPTVEGAVRGVLTPETPTPVLVAGIVAGMMAVVVMGGHPIVIASILLAVFASVETQVHDLVVGAAVLLGWGCSAMIAPAGLIMIVSTGMFGVRRASVIFSESALLLVAFAGAGIGLLAVFNALVA